MTVAEPADAQDLVGVGPPPERARLAFGRSTPDNPFGNIPLAAYQDPVWVQTGIFGRAYLVNDPEGVRRVLVEKVANYPKMDFENQVFRALFGDGLLSREGEAWRAHRRIMAPAFDPRSVAGYAAAMSEAAAGWAQAWSALPEGAEIDVSAEMTRLTLEIICRTMFSGDHEEMTGLTGSALSDGGAALDFGLLDILPVIGPMRMRRRVRDMAKVFAPMDAAIRRLIAARRADPGRMDLLGRLVAAMDEDTGARLTEQEVRDEVLTIFVAGHETTASALTFAWYALARRPAWEAALHAELDAVLGGRAPTEADLPNLDLTRRFIEETMRLYPPAPGVSTRVAREDDQIAGVRIPKGAPVAISSWVLHRHRALWDAPDRFDPDRFRPEQARSRPRFAYLPFGGGPRVCIGQVMAMQEAVLILAALAQRFRLRLRPGHTVAIQQRVTIRPRGGLPMRIEPRAPAWEREALERGGRFVVNRSEAILRRGG